MIQLIAMRNLVFICTLLYSVILSGQERITLLFVGDLMQHQAQIDAARTPNGSYDYKDCFSLVEKQIKEADIAIGNLEVTLGGSPYRGYPAFSAPDEYLYAIKDAGFDVLLTANNHCLDRGSKGLERTILMLDSLQIAHLGTYKDAKERATHHPYILRKNGFCIALLNYTYDTNGLRPTGGNIVNYITKEEILKDIQIAHTYRPDAIIACMHWGVEYKQLPNQEQKELANWLIDQGVTHIIGSHPHVIQPIELREEGTRKHLIVYSLGNFISNMSAPNTDGGLIVTLTLEKHPLPSPIPPYFLQRSYAPNYTDHSYQCHLSHCNYSLVWTSRPILSNEKNFKLYPVNYPTDNIPTTARKKLDTFTQNSRNLLEKYNIGVSEKR